MAFFRAYGFKPNEFDRFAIDPRRYVLSRSTEKAGRGTDQGSSSDQNAGSWIEAEKQALRSMVEGRHERFFDFGCRLLYNGCSDAEIEHHLIDVAGHDAKMKNKVKGMMASLKKYRADWSRA